MRNLVLIFICLQIVFSIQNEDLTTVDKIFKEFESKSKKDIFKVWHLIFNKSYDLASEEAKLRFRNFKINLKYIEEFNSKKGNTFELGIGPFTDLTNQEYQEMHLMSKESINNQIKYQTPEETFLDEFGDDVKEIDWRNKLPPIKNQGVCGSCWAFAAICVSEGFINKNSKKEITALSEQALMECNFSNVNRGCKGGDAFKALDFLTQNGLPSEKDYPYISEFSKGVVGDCKNQIKKNNIKGIPTKLTTQSFKVELKKSPIAVSLDASSIEFQHYKKGIYDNPSPGNSSHYVAIVAFKAGVYVVRNSWGVDWGEKGYVRMKEGSEIEKNPASILI